MEILYFCLCAFLGILCGAYLALRYTKVEQKQIDEEYYKKIEKLNAQIQTDQMILDDLIAKQELVKTAISDSKIQADKASKEFYNQAMENARLRIAADLNEEEEKYEQAISDYKNEYNQVVVDLTAEFNNIMLKNQQDISLTKEKLSEAQSILDDLKSKIDSVTEANKRIELEKNEKDFYRCLISEQDQEEIKRIRSIEPYLRDKDALNKVIWKVYYQKPYTDLIGRVIGNKIKTGIYKITNLENNKVYIGQAVNIADRWSQHIKRGIGAEAPTRNKLYPAMLSSGVENFSFEVLEECVANKLNEKEKYWIDFYHGYDYGYNETRGNNT